MLEASTRTRRSPRRVVDISFEALAAQGGSMVVEVWGAPGESITMWMMGAGPDEAFDAGAREIASVGSVEPPREPGQVPLYSVDVTSSISGGRPTATDIRLSSKRCSDFDGRNPGSEAQLCGDE